MEPVAFDTTEQVAFLVDVFTNCVREDVRHRVVQAIVDYESAGMIGRIGWIKNGRPCLGALTTMAATENKDLRNEDFDFEMVAGALGITPLEARQAESIWYGWGYYVRQPRAIHQRTQELADARRRVWSERKIGPGDLRIIRTRRRRNGGDD